MELKEVELKKVDDFMFKRIGVDVPMLPDAQGFSSDQLPARALAVSNRFGYCLYAHSLGFSAAKTADLIEVAEKLKDKSNPRQTAQEKSIVTVPGNNIRSVSLSSDELTVAVCSGGSVSFHDLPTLVGKSDICPFEVRKVDQVEDTHAKEFSWSPTDTDAYLMVTNNQKLLLGRLGSAPDMKVEKDVLAASWSDDGQHVAYVSENRQLSITTSTFDKSFNLELPAHLSDEDDESDLNVDTIRWVRPDSIMVGYVRVNSEGEEDGYPLFVVTSASGNLAEERSKTLGLYFYQLFPSIDSFVTPSGSGPYMLADYLKPWEVVVAASRKSIDDHIVLVGWVSEDGKDEAYSLELGNDLWLPRIELQESNDDNAIVGLAIDRTTVQIQLTDPKDDAGESKLPPSPVLICVTLEGRLSFFCFARLDAKRQLPNLVSAPSIIPESKRSTKRSSQVSGKVLSATSLPATEIPVDSELQSSPKQPDMRDRKEDGMLGRLATERGGKDSTVSLVEGLTRPSSSFQSGSPQKPAISGPRQASPPPKADGPKLGLISGSHDSKQSSLIPGFALAMGDKGAENMANPYQSLFRPFEDGSKSGSSMMNANFPPAFSFHDSARPNALTKAGSFQNPAITVPSSALGTTSQVTGGLSKGNDKVSSTRSVSPQPQRAFQFPAGTSSFSLSSASPGKGFQAGANALSSGLTTHSPSTSSQGMRDFQAGGITSRVNPTQRVDKVNPGVQSWAGQDQQPQGRATGVSDMEAAFISELEKVKRMAEEVDQLMSYIEGRATTGNLENNATFTRQSLEELEQGIHLLSEDCKAHRRQLTQEKQNVEDLRDECLRVDSWRIYARTLMEQKSDTRHQELWTLQKLHPELDMKRKRVLKADQDLKLKIAEMEKHLHSLELKQWQVDNARRRPNKKVRNPGQFLSVQYLYNTVNTQMAVAEELSLSLAQQMKALSIDWSAPAKSSKKSTSASILRSVGAQPDVKNPSMEVNGQSPVSRRRFSYSPVANVASSVDRVATPVGQVPDLGVSTQETTRRRRDSMDATWVDSGAPKTTIKRPVHVKPNQGFAPSNASLPTFRQGRGNIPEASARESWSQSRHVRQTQSTRMASQSTNSSFPSPGLESAVPAPFSGRTSSSGPPWFAQPDLQRRSSSTPPNGDFGGAHTPPLGTSSSVGNLESKESLFKWANNSVSGSKVTPIAPAHPFLPFGKQGTGSTFDGSSFALADKTSSISASKQSSYGSIGGTAGNRGNVGPVPATRPRLVGAFDAGAVDMMGRSVGSTKLGNKFSLGGNQMDDSRLDIETNQAQGGSFLVRSAPHATGPVPSSFLVGPKSTPSPLVLPGSTSVSGASASTSQSLQAPVRGFEAKQESDGRTDRGNESQPSLKQISVATFLAQPSISASKIQKTEVVPSLQATEPVKQSDEIKSATNSENASLATSGSSGKGFVNLSSKSASAGQGPGSFPSPATVSSSPRFTFATGSAISSQPQVSKSLFTTGKTTPVEASSSAGKLSTTSSSSNGGGRASSPSTTGGATTSQSTALASSAADDKSGLGTLTPTGASPFLSSAVASKLKFELQGNTFTTSNSLPVPNAHTGHMSGSVGASAGEPASSTSSISSDLGKYFLTSAPTAAAPMQSAGSPFTASSIPATAQSTPSPFTVPSGSAPPQIAASPFASSSMSGFSTAGTQVSSSPFGQSSTWPSSGQQPFIFPNSSPAAPTASITPAGLVDNDEDDMEEEASTGANTSVGGFGGFGVLGLGSSITPAETQKTNPFGGSGFGSSPAPTLSAPSGGQLFRPAAFSLPAAQSSSPQQSGGSPFGSGFGSPEFSQNQLCTSSDAGKPFGSPSQASPGGFGQPAQLGPGQQALGSALGAFGQTRQVGFGTPSFGASGGFGATPQGGGFARAATGAGFANAATGGGFASAATGGGFAGAATGGGFAGAAAGGGFGSSPGGGFQGFSPTQGAQPFGGGGIQASLFTQMRK